MTGARTIPLADFHKEMQAQGVERADVAFRCVTCGTIQSMRTIVAAGVTPDKAENYIGFSCEGRWRGAKAARNGKPADPNVRGCDWSLGGLFNFSKLIVEMPDGRKLNTFELATPEEAQALAVQAIDGASS